MRVGIALSVLFMITGCATTTNYYASSNEAVLATGEQSPEGYPKVYVLRAEQGCVQATESWRKDTSLVQGKTVWLKQVERVAVNCK